MPAPHFNLARFDLVSIRLAVACAQGGSLTAAARQMHLALAAASRRVRELEDAIGQPCLSAMRAA
jgi:DNA-binding transcriptional LysR family regulator